MDLKTKLESKTNHIKYVEAKLADMESNYQNSIEKNEKEYNDKLEELKAMFNENRSETEKK